MSDGWRDPTQVLCFYEYVGYSPRHGTLRLHDSIMLEDIEFEDQVLPAFDRALRERRIAWNFCHVGPRPMEWTLISCLLPGGKTLR